MGYLVLSIVFLATVIPIVALTYNMKLTFFQGLYSATGSMLISFFMNVTYIKYRTGENVIDYVINTSFKQITDVFSNGASEIYGNVSAEHLETLKLNMMSLIASLKDLYIALFPAVIILMLLLFAYILFMAVKNILSLLNKDMSTYPRFCQLKMTKGSIYALGISLVCASLISDVRIANAFLNISTILVGVGTCCGLSFFDYQIRKRVDNIWIRISVYLAVFFMILSLNTYIIYILVFIAIFDSFFNFRRLRIKEDNNG